MADISSLQIAIQILPTIRPFLATFADLFKIE